MPFFSVDLGGQFSLKKNILIISLWANTLYTKLITLLLLLFIAFLKIRNIIEIIFL